MFGILVEVDLDPQNTDVSRKVLREEIVPRVSALPGFVHGYWLVPQDDQGASLILFQTEEDARAAATSIGLTVGASPAPGVTFSRIELRGVAEHA